MIWNSLKAHAKAIRDTVALINDETYPEPTRRGAGRYLRQLLDDYEFIDNKVDGFAIKKNWADLIEELKAQH